MPGQVRLTSNLELCRVCEVLSPIHFYLQRQTHQSFPGFENYNENLRVMYETVEEGNLTLNISAAKVGTICIARIQGNFQRVRVLNIELDLFYVRAVDHGGSYVVRVEDMKELHPNFSNYPLQAIECKLASVCPFQSSDGWLVPFSNEALEYVIRLKGQEVMARALFHGETGIPIIELFRITEDKKLIDVAAEMASLGLVQYDP